MTNAELISLMMSRLGSRSSPALRTRVVTELNEKIKQLERGSTLPWFMEDRWTAVTVANVDSVDLPVDFIQEVEEGRLKLQNSALKWGRLPKVSYEALEDETENQVPAQPDGYAIFGEKIYFGPMPDAAYNFKLPYYKRSAAVVDNSEEVSNKWLLEFQQYTTLATLNIVASLHLQSSEMVQKIAPELNTAYDIFWRAVEARKHSNMDYLLDNAEN